jgi:hypothetical protein
VVLAIMVLKVWLSDAKDFISVLLYTKKSVASEQSSVGQVVAAQVEIESKV